MIINWLLRKYIKQNREINKIDPVDEMKSYLFNTPNDVYKILKANLTAQTVRHFEANNREERLAVKGSALILKIMIEAHRFAKDNWDKNNPDESLKKWRKFKTNNKIN